MLAFWEREYDVLVCTTIVESGLDIANANTLIVERADNFGLSQLHQLRGRVGRGRERAYAYFLYDAQRPLTETAYDRLATIAANTDLGAGMAVAMKDLEIRGAGNLLGGEQSGHIAAVGFDLYIRLVGEAVADFRGEAPEELPEVKVELPINANLPRDYITGERLRLEAYRRIAEVGTPEQLAEVRAELIDRYGTAAGSRSRTCSPWPQFRLHARRYGVHEVAVQGRYIRFAPLELRESQTLRLQRHLQGRARQAGASSRCWCRSRPRPAGWGRRRCAIAACSPGRQELLDAVAGDYISAAAGAAGAGPARLRRRLTRRLRLVKLRSIASRRFVSRTGIAALALVAVPAVTSCQTRIGLAASVGSQQIETSQLTSVTSRSAAALAATGQTVPANQQSALTRGVLNLLVRDALLEEIGKAQGITVTPSELAAERASEARQAGGDAGAGHPVRAGRGFGCRPRHRRAREAADHQAAEQVRLERQHRIRQQADRRRAEDQGPGQPALRRSGTPRT